VIIFHFYWLLEMFSLSSSIEMSSSSLSYSGPIDSTFEEDSNCSVDNPYTVYVDMPYQDRLDNIYLPRIEGFRSLFYEGKWYYQYRRVPQFHPKYERIDWNMSKSCWFKSRYFKNNPRKPALEYGKRIFFTDEYGWVLQVIPEDPYEERRLLKEKPDFCDDSVLYEPEGVNYFVESSTRVDSLSIWNCQTETYNQEPLYIANVESNNRDQLFREIRQHAGNIWFYVTEMCKHRDPVFEV
jgi:hypothetical protein